MWYTIDNMLTVNQFEVAGFGNDDENRCELKDMTYKYISRGVFCTQINLKIKNNGI